MMSSGSYAIMPPTTCRWMGNRWKCGACGRGIIEPKMDFHCRVCWAKVISLERDWCRACGQWVKGSLRSVIVQR